MQEMGRILVDVGPFGLVLVALVYIIVNGRLSFTYPREQGGKGTSRSVQSVGRVKAFAEASLASGDAGQQPSLPGSGASGSRAVDENLRDSSKNQG